MAHLNLSRSPDLLKSTKNPIYPYTKQKVVVTGRKCLNFYQSEFSKSPRKIVVNLLTTLHFNIFQEESETEIAWPILVFGNTSVSI